MASVMSSHNTYGFYNAPVSKGLVGSLVLTCTALNLPLFVHLKKYLICKLPESLIKVEVWRLLTTKLFFTNTKEVFLGTLLLYCFRIFERRYGSHKFGSYIVCCQVISILLETAAVFTLQWLGYDWHGGGYMSSGPHSIVFSLFVCYFLDIPQVAHTRFLGIPFSGKTILYIVGLQMCASSPSTAVAAACGIVSGLFYRFNVLRVTQVPWVPKCVAKMSDGTLGRLLASAPPLGGPLGATLELQRQEQMEIWEQQMLANRAREMRNRPGGDGDIPPFMQSVMGIRRGNNPGLTTEPTEEQIQTLVEMGFDRAQVVAALQATNNDVISATHRLLQQT